MCVDRMAVGSENQELIHIKHKHSEQCLTQGEQSHVSY